MFKLPSGPLELVDQWPRALCRAYASDPPGYPAWARGPEGFARLYPTHARLYLTHARTYSACPVQRSGPGVFGLGGPKGRRAHFRRLCCRDIGDLKSVFVCSKHFLAEDIITSYPVIQSDGSYLEVPTKPKFVKEAVP